MGPEPQKQQEDGGSPIARIAAVLAVLVAVGALAFVLLGSDDPYRVKARFQSASQVVKGNLVQASGRKVGTVEQVELTDNGEAELTLKLEDEVVPLREGTHATLRQASLSGVANRYVDLALAPAGRRSIPNDGVIESRNTTPQVDLDQLFALFDAKTRQGLTRLIRGFAATYQGRGAEANAGWQYLNPSLIATRRLFSELNRDEALLRRFVVKNSQFVSDVAERRDDLARLVNDLAIALGAIGRERVALASAIRQLPPFMRRANTTFVNLRATLDEVDPLVAESKPVARKLRPVFRQLRLFAFDARPTIRNLANLVRLPGPRNDLYELSESTLPLRDITIGPVRANGRLRRGAFAESTESLHHQTPHWAFQRPYAVDLTGWFDDFSHSGLYDAFGSASRVATSVNAFQFVAGTLPPPCIPAGGGRSLCPVPPLQRADQFRSVAMLGQNNRCPGAIERDQGNDGIPWRPSPDYNCDPNQRPLGP